MLGFKGLWAINSFRYTSVERCDVPLFGLPCEICPQECNYVSTLFPFSLCSDLDNSDANERLKFSILKRLPEVLLRALECVCVCGQTWGLNAGPGAALISLSDRERLKGACSSFSIWCNHSKNKLLAQCQPSKWWHVECGNLEDRAEMYQSVAWTIWGVKQCMRLLPSHLLVRGKFWSFLEWVSPQTSHSGPIKSLKLF